MTEEVTSVTKDVSEFKGTGLEQLSKDVGKYTTMDLSNRENQIELYNAIQKCDVLLYDIKGQVIEIKDIFVERRDFDKEDEKTGEIKKVSKYKSILFGVDGTKYVSTAKGIYNSLCSIISIFGLPSSTSPFKLKVETKALDKGQALILLMVNE